VPRKDTGGFANCNVPKETQTKGGVSCQLLSFKWLRIMPDNSNDLLACLEGVETNQLTQVPALIDRQTETGVYKHNEGGKKPCSALKSHAKANQIKLTHNRKKLISLYNP